MNIPSELKYTSDHEWTRISGNEVEVGITAFAVEQLGDITIVGFDVKPGDEVEKGQVFGTVESVKTVSDLYAPVSGKVLRLNEELDGSPEKVNDDPYAAWMVVFEVAEAAATAELLDAAAYEKLTG